MNHSPRYNHAHTLTTVLQQQPLWKTSYSALLFYSCWATTIYRACTYTEDTGDEYWEVTLEKNYNVHHVNIWGLKRNWETVGAEVIS